MPLNPITRKEVCHRKDGPNEGRNIGAWCVVMERVGKCWSVETHTTPWYNNEGMKIFTVCALRQILLGQMGRDCSTHGRHEDFIQQFWQKIWTEEIIFGRPAYRWEDITKNDLTKIGCADLTIIPSTHNYYVHLTISVTQHVSAKIGHRQVFLKRVFSPPK
jgi:hypothetical protein